MIPLPRKWEVLEKEKAASHAGLQPGDAVDDSAAVHGCCPSGSARLPKALIGREHHPPPAVCGLVVQHHLHGPQVGVGVELDVDRPAARHTNCGPANQDLVDRATEEPD